MRNWLVVLILGYAAIGNGQLAIGKLRNEGALANCQSPAVTRLLPIANSAASNDIQGVWYNQDRDAKIQIFQCGDRYCGKLVWLKRPTFALGSKHGPPGTPRTDYKNPDPALRKVPLMGLEIMHGMQFAGGNEWNGGTVYDPKSGKTYHGKMTLVSPNQLNLRGYVGISLFGRTEKWTRAQ